MEINVKVDKRAVERMLKGMARQAPFATSLALNRMGKAIIEEAKRDFPRQFTRRTDWTDKGWRQKPASKQNLVTTLSHRDEYMALQEEGGEKKPKPGSRTVAVPKGARSTPQSVTRQSQWPGALIRKGKAFPIPTKGGDTIIVSRIGKTKRGKLKKGTKAQRSAPQFASDPALRVMYILKRRVRVKPRLKFKHRAEQFVARHWGEYAAAAVEQAIRTAR